VSLIDLYGLSLLFIRPGLRYRKFSYSCYPTANCVMWPLGSVAFFNIAKCRRGQKIHYVCWLSLREFFCDIAATSAVWVRVRATVSIVRSPISPDLKQPNVWISKTFRPLKMRPPPCLGKSETNYKVTQRHIPDDRILFYAAAET